MRRTWLKFVKKDQLRKFKIKEKEDVLFFQFLNKCRHVCRIFTCPFGDFLSHSLLTTQNRALFQLREQFGRWKVAWTPTSEKMDIVWVQRSLYLILLSLYFKWQNIVVSVSRRFNTDVRPPYVVEPQQLCIFLLRESAVWGGKHRISTWTNMVSQVVGGAEHHVAHQESAI